MDRFDRLEVLTGSKADGIGESAFHAARVGQQCRRKCPGTASDHPAQVGHGVLLAELNKQRTDGASIDVPVGCFPGGEAFADLVAVSGAVECVRVFDSCTRRQCNSRWSFPSPLLSCLREDFLDLLVRASALLRFEDHAEQIVLVCGGRFVVAKSQTEMMLGADPVQVDLLVLALAGF